MICYQLYKKASFSVNLRGSDLGRKWERSTLHNHDIIKDAGCVMNMEYLKTWLTPRKYINQNSIGDSSSYNLSHSAMQQTPLLLWKPVVHYHLHNSQLLDTT